MSRRKIIDCSSGISPLGPSRKVKAAIRKAAKKAGTYPEAELARFRRLLTSKYGVPGDCILVGGSREELIYLIASAVKPRKALVAGLSPDVYEKASLAAGAEVKYIAGNELSGFVVGPDEIRGQLEGVDLLFTANPNLITGVLTGRQGLSELFQYASELGVVSVVDESLIEFTADDSYLSGLVSSDNIIVVRTTAFYYGLAGLELAYAVASPSTIRRLAEARVPQAGTLAVEAAIAAIKDKTYKRLVKEFVLEEKSLLMRSFRGLEGITCRDSDSNIVQVKMLYPEETLRALAAGGFSFRSFAGAAALPPDFLGLSVMGHDKNQRFIRMLKRRLRSGTAPAA